MPVDWKNIISSRCYPIFRRTESCFYSTGRSVITTRRLRCWADKSPIMSSCYSLENIFVIALLTRHRTRYSVQHFHVCAHNLANIFLYSWKRLLRGEQNRNSSFPVLHLPLDHGLLKFDIEKCPYATPFGTLNVLLQEVFWNDKEQAILSIGFMSKYSGFFHTAHKVIRPVAFASRATRTF